MNARRNVLVAGTAVLAAFAAVGCSAENSSHAAKAAAGPDTVTYHADYPAYSSLDDVLKTSDAVVEGTVVGTRVQKVLPDAPAGDNPATNPQAGLSPVEAKAARKAAEENPVIVTVSKVKVTRALAGKVAVGDTIEVSQLGGTYHGVAYQDEDTTLLAKGGQRYVLMLAAHGKNPYDLLNPEQALYSVKADGTVKAVSVNGFDGAGKVDQLAAKAGRIAGSRTR
ncbi:hypothetical protein [Streptomyces sp. NRRL B-3648]|uniref:hypothetical protein n=1 Tax=Streptomyces sp. NRRL B-3648 TaxID=1519493 RepID=UPI0006ADF7B5|nr:hypothetical protein [Streptomyces sp. NRRL B-3648]KOV89514.1 hypothetical protein ADL04_38365 [Streptomyces sp. NRRL B-3648]